MLKQLCGYYRWCWVEVRKLWRSHRPIKEVVNLRLDSIIWSLRKSLVEWRATSVQSTVWHSTPTEKSEFLGVIAYFFMSKQSFYVLPSLSVIQGCLACKFTNEEVDNSRKGRLLNINYGCQINKDVLFSYNHKQWCWSNLKTTWSTGLLLMQGNELQCYR